MLLRNVFLLLILLVAATGSTRADESCQLWLKYDRIADMVVRQQYLHSAQLITGAGTTVLQAASGELQRGLNRLLRQAVSGAAAAGSRTSGIVLRIDKQASTNKQLLRAEGYRIFSEKDLLIMGRTTPRRLCAAVATYPPWTR